MFPSLFISKDETERFLSLFKKTGQWKSAGKEIYNSIIRLVLEKNREYDCNKENRINPQHWMEEIYALNPENHAMKLYINFYCFFHNQLIQHWSSARLLVVKNKKSLSDHRTLYSMLENSVFQEIVMLNETFLRAISHNNIAFAIRCIQSLSEILLFIFEFNDSGLRLDKVVENSYFSDIPEKCIKKVLLTPYAMRLFTRVFQLLDSNCNQDKPLCISVTNQSYFEWLTNLELINKKSKSVSFIRHLENVNQDFDMLFTEFHMNNVVENRQFSHNVDHLIDRFLKGEFRQKRRTLVLDVTLNFLDDEEIKDLVKRLNPLLANGELNLIFIQSLTKFAQMGLDKRSGGLMVIINNDNFWKNMNEKANRIDIFENMDRNFSTQSYFALLLSGCFVQADYTCKGIFRDYVNIVNNNTKVLYSKVTSKLSELETLKTQYFQITMSSDPKACYIALNVNGLLSVPISYPGFSIKIEKVENFLKSLFRFLIIPLCKDFNLPLTERMSIGFPLSSFNIVYSSIRWTVGLETNDQLEHYADIIAYSAFVLNRNTSLEKILYSSAEIVEAYFSEKFNQFRAMTPGLNAIYRFAFHRPDESTLTFLLNNGQIILWRPTAGGHSFLFGERFLYEDFSLNEIYLPIRGQGRVLFSDPQISLQVKRIAIACLSTGNQENQNVKLRFRNRFPFEKKKSTVEFSSFEIISYWNMSYKYGLFYVYFDESQKKQGIYFRLSQKQITVVDLEKNILFDQDHIRVKQGFFESELSTLPLEEREFLIRAGGYHPQGAYNKINPLAEDKTQISIGEKGLTIERDFSCVNTSDMSVYKRFISPSTTCVEIDCWSEKNPSLARFLRLMVAIFVKEKAAEIGFLARDGRFTHFLFNLTFNAINDLFQEAAEKVTARKLALQNIFESYKGEKSRNLYLFFNKGNIERSNEFQLSYCDDKDLIMQGVDIIISPPSL